MATVESNSESEGGQDSQIMSENSIFLEQNVEGFQKCVKDILNLIEQNENVSEITAEIYDCKKSELTKLVNKLSSMHGALVDQKVHLIKEVKKKDFNQTQFVLLVLTIAWLKKQLVSKQAWDLDMCERETRFTANLAKRDDEIKELIVRNFLLKVAHVATEGRLKTDNERLNTRLDFLMSYTDALEKEDRQGEAEIEKINEQIKELNAEIKVLKSIHADEGNKWNAYTERLKKDFKEKCELANDLKQKHDALMSCTDELKLKVMELKREVGSQSEKTTLGLAEIAKRNAQIQELISHINQQNDSHASDDIRWKTCTNLLRREVREKHEIIVDLNNKYHHETDELKAKVVELEREVEAISEAKREVIRQLSFTVEHYKSAYTKLRELLVTIKRMIDLS